MWKRILAVSPGVGVSLLPKLMCPMCWPAYAGIVSALGLGFLISTKYLLPLTVAFLAITATALGFRASRRRGYGPFWLGLVAAAVILTGKFYFDARAATYTGVALLVAASVWNSWPRRAAVVPSCCVPAGVGFTQNLQGEQIHETQN
jgi:mercuric ion transport protein